MINGACVLAPGVWKKSEDGKIEQEHPSMRCPIEDKPSVVPRVHLRTGRLEGVLTHGA
jgi:hypothetical protein